MDFTKCAPSKFKGNFKENAQRWFDTYECFANLCSWDEITFCTAFPLFLEEFAQIWFFELSSDIWKKKDALKLEFLIKYQHCYGQKFQRYCDFDDLKQNEDESVADFINRLYTITENLDINDDRKMTKMRIRCKPELIHLFGKEPETLAETEKVLHLQKLFMVF